MSAFNDHQDELHQAAVHAQFDRDAETIRNLRGRIGILEDIVLKLTIEQHAALDRLPFAFGKEADFVNSLPAGPRERLYDAMVAHFGDR